MLATLATSDFMRPFFDIALFFFVLLNPFLMSVYLVDLVRELEARAFVGVLVRASLIAGIVFAVFALTGEGLFDRVLQVRFAAFQLFGGVIFLLIGIRYVFQGPGAMEGLRGPPEHLAGKVAMPFMVGPGTVSVAVLAGYSLPSHLAVAAVLAAMFAGVLGLIALKLLHDYVSSRNETLVERYLEVVGRVSALLIGTVAVDMILTGLEGWQQG